MLKENIKKGLKSIYTITKEYIMYLIITFTVAYTIAATDFLDDIIWDSFEWVDDAFLSVFLIPLSIMIAKRLKK